MSNVTWAPVASDGTYRYEAMALAVFWPEPEYHAVIARWPQLVEQLGATWDEHRRIVERQCAFIERDGLGVCQLPADLRGFSAFLAKKKVKTPGTEDLLAYPDLRDVTISMTAWPPARTAACWCGSGRKYKQCCRPYGLGTLD